MGSIDHAADEPDVTEINEDLPWNYEEQTIIEEGKEESQSHQQLEDLKNTQNEDLLYICPFFAGLFFLSLNHHLLLQQFGEARKEKAS